MKSSRIRRLSRALKRKKTPPKKQYRAKTSGLLSSLWVQGLLVVLGIAFLVMLILGTVGAYQTWSEVRQEASVAEKKFLEAQERYQRASTSLNQVQTQAGLEKQLRQRFNVAKEDEGVVVILDSSANTGAPEGGNQYNSWWKRVLFFWR